MVELVEGKTRPTELGPKKFNMITGSELKTVGLVLRMTKSMYYSRRVVIMDSGFCVLRGLIELAKRGFFASAVIKKRRYWTKYVPGDKIKEYFLDKPVGTSDALHGILDNTPFHIFCLKEENYVMSLMSTYGTMEKGCETKRIIEDGKK
eukprot:CAMPEP_0194154998 /NCGR_PEP_ID=MMETSP0152-20130528/62825_1 /TAXON_ID=1049557 /ORGANISM="Thalassiothrix antarctica, Strain L6-D1" /LENGTH=148 /DNA_ID=CAMNT_0038861527 /DNA_START=890 /DNA_END=1336 /DNA_ORIENTATION=-